MQVIHDPPCIELCFELKGDVMAMMSFVTLCPKVGNKETRRVGLMPEAGVKPTNNVPSDWYFFEELYCDEPECDCRRVMINVIASSTGRHLATINHAFEPPEANAHVPEQTFLDPLNKQSRYAEDLMDLFLHVINNDEAYRKRLIRHYEMFKDAIGKSSLLMGRKRSSLPTNPSDPGIKPRVIPPPPRRGRRKWR